MGLLVESITHRLIVFRNEYESGDEYDQTSSFYEETVLGDNYKFADISCVEESKFITLAYDSVLQ